MATACQGAPPGMANRGDERLELAVFDTRLDIRVRRLDELAKRYSVCGRSRSQFHMTHSLARALQ